MKIAYFSPLPPKRTGIAAYSSYLIPALKQLMEVHLFDHGTVDLQADCPLFDYVSDPVSLLKLNTYDACVYHIGNNPYYHDHIYQILLYHPGVVVLHDSVLYYLIAGAGPGALLKELSMNNGMRGLADLAEILRDSPGSDILRYPFPERFPLLTRTLRQARAVIVHSETTRQLLLQTGYTGYTSVIHMVSPGSGPGLHYIPDLPSVREELGLANDALLIGTFGFIGRTKRISTILNALRPLCDRLSFKLLLLGEGEDLTSAIRHSGFEDRIIRPGFVSDLQFARYLRAADIVVNLRYPSMGEASLTLIQAMYYSRPCIVTSDAWFAELPDTCVYKIPADDTEIDDLKRVLLTLAEDANLRRTLGDAARAYVLSHCLPEHIAADYHAVLNQAALQTHVAARTPIGAKSLGDSDAGAARQGEHTYDGWLKLYFERRIARALPRDDP